jgi:hypothetical protein
MERKAGITVKGTGNKGKKKQGKGKKGDEEKRNRAGKINKKRE